MEVSGQSHALAALPSGNISLYPFDRRLCGLCGRENCRELKQVRPLRSPSLYRLSYHTYVSLFLTFFTPSFFLSLSLHKWNYFTRLILSFAEHGDTVLLPSTPSPLKLGPISHGPVCRMSSTPAPFNHPPRLLYGRKLSMKFSPLPTFNQELNLWRRKKIIFFWVVAFKIMCSTNWFYNHQKKKRIITTVPRLVISEFIKK